MTAALVAAVIVFIAWPSTIEPQAWTPPPIAAGMPVPEHFPRAERIHSDLQGPAFIAPGPGHELLTGLADGRLAIAEPLASGGDDEREERRSGREQEADEGRPTASPEIVGIAPGRPFGVARGLGEVVIAAASGKGLIAAVEGRIVTITSEAVGKPFGYVADVAVSFPRSRIYFTDASDRHGPADSWSEFVEHAGRGRLLAFDSVQHQTNVLADGLHFPFGIALADDGSFLLICEMTAYRVARYWLEGPRAGKLEAFSERLPGYPADIAADGHGGWWLSLYAPRIGALDRLAGLPWLRALWFKLPRALQPKPARETWLLGLDADGRIQRALRDDSAGAYAPVTGVLLRDGALYLGSPTEHGILRLQPGGSS